MRSRILLCAVATVSTAAIAARAAEQPLAAQVDPRVELVSIVYRLSGANEYNQPLASSPYTREVDAHFGAFRDHPVVRAAQELRATHGISYDAPMTLALHLGDTTAFAERFPFDQEPSRLLDRWKPNVARDFVGKLRDFAEATHFNAFADQHRPLYEATAARMSAHLESRPYVKWFDSYFGARPAAEFRVIVSLLNGPCNYGAGIRFPGGGEEITPIIGAAEFDAEGIPVFRDTIAETVVHEFCHSYTNPMVDAAADELRPAGERIFAHCRERMSAQAYATWHTMMYESFVRAVVVRYIHSTEGQSAARTLANHEAGRGFEWVGRLSDLLAEYESNRDRFPVFSDFVPRIVAFFNDYAVEYESAKREQSAKAPKIVSLTPANGATDVDPGLTAITIVFDRPMTDKAWSVVGGGPHFMELTGQPSYDNARQVLTLPVRLKPDWSYEFWLNRPPYESFQSAEGVKLGSVHITFKTRA